MFNFWNGKEKFLQFEFNLLRLNLQLQETKLNKSHKVGGDGGYDDWNLKLTYI